jgi:hypothetical protein
MLRRGLGRLELAAVPADLDRRAAPVVGGGDDRLERRAGGRRGLRGVGLWRLDGGSARPVVPVRSAWQDVLHWNAPAAWRDGPARFDERAYLYGFPDVDGLGLKAVTHEPGPPFDVDRAERIPAAGAIEAIRNYLAAGSPRQADGARQRTSRGAGPTWRGSKREEDGLAGRHLRAVEPRVNRLSAAGKWRRPAALRR